MTSPSFQVTSSPVTESGRCPPLMKSGSLLGTLGQPASPAQHVWLGPHQDNAGLTVHHHPGALQCHLSVKLVPLSFREHISVPHCAGPRQLLPWLLHLSAFHQEDAATAELSLARVI